jgi:hypothetical protein
MARTWFLRKFTTKKGDFVAKAAVGIVHIAKKRREHLLKNKGVGNFFSTPSFWMRF